MRKIKTLNENIPYSKLYNQLKRFKNNKSSSNDFVMGGLSMEDGTPINSFSTEFYGTEYSQVASDDANSLLRGQLDKARLSLKTPYDEKENATSIDKLGTSKKQFLSSLRKSRSFLLFSTDNLLCL